MSELQAWVLITMAGIQTVLMAARALNEYRRDWFKKSNQPLPFRRK